jgi:hypothetical protein
MVEWGAPWGRGGFAPPPSYIVKKCPVKQGWKPGLEISAGH